MIFQSSVDSRAAAGESAQQPRYQASIFGNLAVGTADTLTALMAHFAKKTEKIHDELP
jgi:hypothetical protein